MSREGQHLLRADEGKHGRGLDLSIAHIELGLLIADVEPGGLELLVPVGIERVGATAGSGRSMPSRS